MENSQVSFFSPQNKKVKVIFGRGPPQLVIWRLRSDMEAQILFTSLVLGPLIELLIQRNFRLRHVVHSTSQSETIGSIPQKKSKLGNKPKSTYGMSRLALYLTQTDLIRDPSW